jgi:hypothetical protein
MIAGTPRQTGGGAKDRCVNGVVAALRPLRNPIAEMFGYERALRIIGVHARDGRLTVSAVTMQSAALPNWRAALCCNHMRSVILA